jgi:hypothetical protein
MAAPAAATAAASSLVAVKLAGVSTRRVIEYPGLGVAIDSPLFWGRTGLGKFPYYGYYYLTSGNTTSFVIISFARRKFTPCLRYL